MTALPLTRTAGISASIVLASLLAAPAALAADPLAPVGELELRYRMVRSGAHVQVTWDIKYPMELGDLIAIGPGGTFNTLEDLDIEVHAIGMEYSTVKSNNGHGNNEDGVDVSNPGRGHGGPNGETDRSGPIDDEKKSNGNSKERELELDATLWIGVNDSWNELFQGGASDLQGGLLHYEGSLPMGTTVNFAAQGESRRGSNDVVSTTTPSPNLIVLKDGDPLPESMGVVQHDTIADFLSGYVDEGKVQLGPLQAIYLFDLDASPGASAFSLQDLGVLISVKPNEERRVPAIGRGISGSPFASPTMR